MLELLSKALLPNDTTDEDAGTNRILAASFFRTRPMQAGTCAEVISLASRASQVRKTSIYRSKTQAGSHSLWAVVSASKKSRS